MRALSYEMVRKNLASAIDDVVNDHMPLIITKENGKAVVMMNLEDWNGWQETLHLLSNPANAERVLEAVEDFGEGKNLIVKESLPEV